MSLKSDANLLDSIAKHFVINNGFYQPDSWIFVVKVKCKYKRFLLSHPVLIVGKSHVQENVGFQRAHLSLQWRAHTTVQFNLNYEQHIYVITAL